MEAIQAAIEQACVEFKDPATQQRAEAVLLQFRQQPRPFAACRHILDHSGSEEAKFQAAATIRDAIVREWTALSPEEAAGLRAYLVQAALRCAPAEGGASGSLVRSTLVSACALAIKRGWMAQAPEARAALVKELQAVASNPGGPGGTGMVRVALELLEALVTQFSLGSAAPLGLPWDYHERCCRDVEEHYLRGFFASAASLARQAAASGAAARGEDGGVCAAAAQLMSACLQWEFKRAGMPGAAAIHVQRRGPGAEGGSVALAPGEAWSELLLAPGAHDWLVGLLGQLRAAYGPAGTWGRPGSPLAAMPPAQRRAVESVGTACRGLLSALCSLTGDVFPRNDPGNARLGFLALLLHGLLPWMWPPQGALEAAHVGGMEGSELLDACRCLAALAPTHKARALQAAGDAVIPSLAGAGAGGAPTSPSFQHQLHHSSSGNLLSAAGTGPQGGTGMSRSQSVGVLPGSSTGAAARGSGPGGAGGAAGPEGGFLGILRGLTLALISAGGVTSGGSSCAGGVDEGDDLFWLRECVDMLLEAWCALLQAEGLSGLGGQGSGGDPFVPAALASCAGDVFVALLHAALADAVRGAREEVEDAHEEAAAAGLDDWLARAAALARAAPGVTLPAMAAALESGTRALAAAASSGADPSEPLEALSWGVRAAGHVLADSGAGETPLVPLPLLHAIESGNAAAAGGVVGLGGALLAVVGLVLQDAARPVVSPRLMEACTWALARWADTYLFPEEDLPAPLAVVYGDGSKGPPPPAVLAVLPPGAPQAQGPVILDMAVQVANACLIHFPGEAMLHAQVCSVLLPVLVRRRPLCERLLGLGAWRSLAAAFAERQPVLVQGLAPKLHRALAQNLCLAAQGVPRTAAAAEYVTSLLAATSRELSALAARPDLQTAAGRGDVATGLCGLLETLRGATKAVLSRTQRPLFELIAPLLTPLLTLMHAFRAHTPVVAAVLKLAADVVEGHVSYLKPAEVDSLLRWVLALVQQYSADNTWGVRMAAARSLQEAAASEAARDLRALLRLLGHVTQRDIGSAGRDHASSGDGGAGSPSARALAAATAANGSRAAGAPGVVDTAQVVLAGLHLLLPLMSHDLLKFPKLPPLYFNLLAYVLENYPEQVSSLPSTQFGALMSSLEFGLSASATDGVVLQSALEGLSGMARHQASCQATGRAGFAVHAAAGGRTVVAHFLELLLRRLLLEDTPADVVELASDALQPLMLCEPQTYATLAGQLVQAHSHDPAAGERIRAALASLVQHPGHHEHLTGAHANSPNGGMLSRQNKRVFRQKLCEVVADVRGIIRVR